jgi:hypothetical protein
VGDDSPYKTRLRAFKIIQILEISLASQPPNPATSRPLPPNPAN